MFFYLVMLAVVIVGLIAFATQPRCRACRAQMGRKAKVCTKCGRTVTEAATL